MQPMFHGEYVVILHDATKLTMSRGYRDTLQQYLGGGK
jgi:DNA-binding LytR/AlgR family response regulator